MSLRVYVYRLQYQFPCTVHSQKYGPPYKMACWKMEQMKLNLLELLKKC